MSTRLAKRLRRELCRVSPREFRSIEDPALASEVARRTERNNLLAVQAGLPAIGSKMVNQHAIEWVVDGHVHLPTFETAERWDSGVVDLASDLFPSVCPTNLSSRLIEFISAVDRCTTKTLLLVDTMPEWRKGIFVPGHNYIDTSCNAGTNIVFLDAARASETIIAHEVGHAWVQYVDQAEDLRVFKGTKNPQLLSMLNLTQSFVTDFRVNDAIRSKGFDMTPIEDDRLLSLASLERAVAAGYRPPSRREEAFMAFSVADALLQGRPNKSLTRVESSLATVQPETYALAKNFAEAVGRHGHTTKEEICRSIDECLLLVFGHCDESIDLESDLIVPEVQEPDFNKYPQWLPEFTAAFKCQMGRIMAREGFPTATRCSFHETLPGIGNTISITFQLPDGTVKGPYHTRAQWKPHIETARMVTQMNRERVLRKAQSAQSNPLELQRLKIQQQNETLMNRPSPTSALSFQSPFLTPGQRFYMPGLARWMTAAREYEHTGAEGAYEYAFGNPTTYTDPSGHFPQKQKKGQSGLSQTTFLCSLSVRSESGPLDYRPGA